MYKKFINSKLSNRPLQPKSQIPFHFTALQSRCIGLKPITVQDFIVLTLGIYCAFLHGLIYEARSRYSNIDLFKSDFIFLFLRCGQFHKHVVCAAISSVGLKSIFYLFAWFPSSFSMVCLQTLWTISSAMGLKVCLVFFVQFCEIMLLYYLKQQCRNQFPLTCFFCLYIFFLC